MIAFYGRSVREFAWSLRVERCSAFRK